MMHQDNDWYYNECRLASIDTDETKLEAFVERVAIMIESGFGRDFARRETFNAYTLAAGCS